MASEIHADDLTTRPAVPALAVAQTDRVCRQVFDLLREIAGVEGGSISLLTDGVLTPIQTFPSAGDDDLIVRVPLGEGVIGTVAQSRAPYYVPDVSQNGGARAGVASYLVVPLVSDAEVVGVLQVDSPDIDAFPEDVQRRIMAVAPLAASALDGARCLEEAKAENAGLQEDARDRKNVLSAVAHELRTPLSAVLGFAETLNQHAAALNPEMLATAGRHMVRASKRLDRLIGDLLDVSRLDRGNFSLRPVPTDVRPIIDQAIFEADSSEHRLVVEVPASLPQVMVDGDRLHQVLVNLLANALKYSETGTTVTLTAASAGDRVKITIADEGMGIPRAELDRIFEPFQRVEDLHRPSVTGLGLGLYLVREICSAMGCEIGATSDIGHGSVFTVAIPVVTS